MALSDVIHVISEGRLSPAFARGTKTPAELGIWMAGHGFGEASRCGLNRSPNPVRAAAASACRRRRWPLTVLIASLLALVAGANPVRHARADPQGRGRIEIRAARNAEPGDAADLHRPRRRRRLPRQALEHRRRGAALCGRGRHRRCSAPARCGCPSLLLIPRHRACARWLAGALVLLGPVLLKTRFGVDEVVTTLLFNFIMLLFVSLPARRAAEGPDGHGLAEVAPPSRKPPACRASSTGCGCTGASASRSLAAVVVWVIQTRTTLGYEMRAVGQNAEAARFAGIPVNRVLVKTALLSGGLAALAGFSEVAGLKGNLTLDLSPGFGYTGIIVAMLALLNPLGRRRLGDLRRRHLRRRRQHEPRGGRADLYRRHPARDRAPDHGAGDPAHHDSGSGGADGRSFDILLSASFWAAAIRIASPLIFATHGRTDLRTRGRAQPRDRGDHGHRRLRRLDGRLSRRAGSGPGWRWRCWRGCSSACCTPCSPCPSACRSMSSASASRCWRPRRPISPIACSLPEVTSPPKIEPFQPFEIPGLSRHPASRPGAVFTRPPLTYLAFVLVAVVVGRPLPHAARPRASRGRRKPGRGRGAGPVGHRDPHGRGDRRLRPDGASAARS